MHQGTGAYSDNYIWVFISSNYAEDIHINLFSYLMTFKDYLIRLTVSGDIHVAVVDLEDFFILHDGIVIVLVSLSWQDRINQSVSIF